MLSKTTLIFAGNLITRIHDEPIIYTKRKNHRESANILYALFSISRLRWHENHPSGHWSTSLKWRCLFIMELTKLVKWHSIFILRYSPPDYPMDIQRCYPDTYRISWQCESLDHSCTLESSHDYMIRHLTPRWRLHILQVRALQSMYYVFFVLCIVVFFKFKMLKKIFDIYKYSTWTKWRSRERYVKLSESLLWVFKMLTMKWMSVKNNT